MITEMARTRKAVCGMLCFMRMKRSSCTAFSRAACGLAAFVLAVPPAFAQDAARPLSPTTTRVAEEISALRESVEVHGTVSHKRLCFAFRQLLLAQAQGRPEELLVLLAALAMIGTLSDEHGHGGIRGLVERCGN